MARKAAQHLRRSLIQTSREELSMFQVHDCHSIIELDRRLGDHQGFGRIRDGAAVNEVMDSISILGRYP